MATFATYTANFQDFDIDTNSGCTVQDVNYESTDYGSSDTYVIQQAGYYKISGIVTFDYTNADADCGVIVRLVHAASDFTPIAEFHSFSPQQNFNGIESSTPSFSVSFEAADQCAAGDIWFVLIEDATGASATISQSLDGTNSYMEGFLISGVGPAGATGATGPSGGPTGPTGATGATGATGGSGTAVVLAACSFNIVSGAVNIITTTGDIAISNPAVGQYAFNYSGSGTVTSANGCGCFEEPSSAGNTQYVVGFGRLGSAGPDRRFNVSIPSEGSTMIPADPTGATAVVHVQLFGTP